MITVDIPGRDELKIEHIVLDYNGTIAVVGRLLPGVAGLLKTLSESVDLHVVTADTFGRAREQLKGLPCKLHILPAENQAQAKQDYARRLGLHNTACIGNGRNDSLMVGEAALGIALVQAEGAAVATVMAADILCLNAVDALSLFTNPKRLVATLRR